jgi:hypothetical protein
VPRVRIGVQPSSAHWPPKPEDDRETVTFVITSEPDKLGRTHFWIKWYDDAHWKAPSWRAQHYFADHTKQEPYWRRLTTLKVAVVFEIEA